MGGIVSKQSPELDKRVRAFYQGEGKGTPTMARWDELSPILDNAMVAYERAAVEEYCRWKLFLPRQGLDIIQTDLERAGFYFQEYSEFLTATLFPDTWELLPSNEFPEDLDQARVAYLLAPDKSRYAQIFYRADTETNAVIWRYKG